MSLNGAWTGIGQTQQVAIVPANLAPAITLNAIQSTANTGENITLTAIASDDVSVTSVEFFVDNQSVGIDTTSPYSINWTATEGSHTIRAEAFDGELTTASSNQSITVTTPSNQLPSVSINSFGTLTDGDSVTFTATSSDSDGSIASEQWYIDNQLISLPWSASTGSYALKVVATDNEGATNEAIQQITVNAQVVEEPQEPVQTVKKYLQGVTIKAVQEQVYKGYGNPLVYDFSLTAYESITLESMAEVNFSWGDQVYSTVTNPNDIEVKNNSLFIWCGGTNNTGDEEMTITADGYLLTINNKLKPIIAS